MVDINRFDGNSKQDQFTPGLNEIAQPLTPGQNDFNAPTPYMQSINLPVNQSQPQYSSQNPTEYQSQPQYYYPQPQYPYEVKPFEYQPLQAPQSQQVIPIQPGIQYQPQIQYNDPIPLTNDQYEKNNIYQQANNLINDNSMATESRLKCQKAMIILLFITVPFSIALQISGGISFITSIDDVLIIMLGIWILYYTKKGEDSRNNKIGAYKIASIYIGIGSRAFGLTLNKSDQFNLELLGFLLMGYSFYLRIALLLPVLNVYVANVVPNNNYQ